MVFKFDNKKVKESFIISDIYKWLNVSRSSDKTCETKVILKGFIGLLNDI